MIAHWLACHSKLLIADEGPFPPPSTSTNQGPRSSDSCRDLRKGVRPVVDHDDHSRTWAASPSLGRHVAVCTPRKCRGTRPVKISSATRCTPYNPGTVPLAALAWRKGRRAKRLNVIPGSCRNPLAFFSVGVQVPSPLRWPSSVARRRKTRPEGSCVRGHWVACGGRRELTWPRLIEVRNLKEYFPGTGRAYLRVVAQVPRPSTTPISFSLAPARPGPVGEKRLRQTTAGRLACCGLIDRDLRRRFLYKTRQNLLALSPRSLRQAPARLQIKYSRDPYRSLNPGHDRRARSSRRPHRPRHRREGTGRMEKG